jgi:hypothetical protein
VIWVKEASYAKEGRHGGTRYKGRRWVLERKEAGIMKEGRGCWRGRR